jgi:hypothetical protein
MQEFTNKNTAHMLNPSLELVESLETIHYFLDYFGSKGIETESWELIQIAFGSKSADGWSSMERSNRLFFHRQLAELAPALAVVDKELRPLFVVEE